MGFNAQAKVNTLWAHNKGKVFRLVGALTAAAIGYGGWQFYQKKKAADEFGAQIQGAANKEDSFQDDPFEEGEEQLNLFEIIEEEPAGSQNTDNGVRGARAPFLDDNDKLRLDTPADKSSSPWWELNGDPEGLVGPQKTPKEDSSNQQGSKSDPEFLPGVKPLF